MGRHSRRGPAPKRVPGNSTESPQRRGTPAPPPPGGNQGPEAEAGTGRQRPPGGDAAPAASGYPPQWQGLPRRAADGTSAHGAPRFPGGTPAHGAPRFPDGTPAGGVPHPGDGAPGRGNPPVRGGHPEQREPGGGWGESGTPGAGPGGPRRPPGEETGFPQQRRAPRTGPRQEYLDAFAEDGDQVFAPARTPYTAPAAERFPSTADWNSTATGRGATGARRAPGPGAPARAKGARGRTFTGIAAAAVTAALAVVVAGQVAGRQHHAGAASPLPTGQARDTHDSASRGDGRPGASAPPSPAPLTYEQKMDRKFPLDPKLKGPGTFDAVPGVDRAPGSGRKYTYRVDVERDVGLDGELFAQAVQKTLNDPRSWSHGGARTFERVSSGDPDFVITLASPGTTHVWCAKSGLDTSEENVSCDSAATPRVMINAYRWAQGSKTYGDRIRAYRQMLINHEIGHRLGHNHALCDKNGELAPVMQQQTKFLDHDGIHCLANPWPYPED
ncbi:DUF3152 domain-containing protein [Streptomyces sp. MS06]|uniref:DUF3152 domain-containing protein n=1 Tax=Streptomyces sp. MS06 TaxID=3385974 RepID=UPI00399FAA01